MILCSTIIPTIIRPTLTRAVTSALEQDLEPGSHEIVVVNDSGEPLPDADWLRSPRVKVVNTHRCERSVARNTGAAVVAGKYLHFLDDDDYLLPGGLRALLRAAEASDCCWVYGALRCVNEDDSVMYENRPQSKGNLFVVFIAGEVLSLIPSVIRRDAFFKVGGFDPLLSVSEDRDLACRLALIGDFDRIDQVVACARVEHNSSSTDFTKATQANRIIREKSLSAPNAFARMQTSLNGRVPLQGAGCWAYLISAVLNVKEGRVLLGLSRLISGLLLAAFYPVFPKFWRGFFYTSRSKRKSPHPPGASH